MKEAFDCQTNSPRRYLWKCIKSSMENMHTDVRMLRVNKYITYVSVRLFGNRSQMTLKCGKNKKRDKRGTGDLGSHVLTILLRHQPPGVYVFCI